MKYKQIIMTIIMMILMTISVNAGRNIYDTDSPVISAVAESITPYPVEPGMDFTVQLRVYNDGGGLAENVSMDFLKSDAFFLTGKGDDFDKPFSVCAGCSKDNIFYFTVLPGMKSGEYPLIFKIKERNVIHEEKVFVRVIGQPDIIFNAVLLNNSVAPDSSFDVKLTVQNVGTGIARNIKIVPQTPGFVMQGSNLIFIDELTPNNSIEKNVHIMVSGNNVPGPQKLTFSLAYKDEKSVAYNLEQALGIRLVNKVKLDLSSLTVSPQPIIVGEPIIITARVENLGEGKAENVQVSVLGNGFDGQNKAFIGKLENNEDSPAVFTLTPTKSGKQDITVVVTYNDDEGEDKIQETVKLTAQRKDGTLIIVAIIATIVLIIYGSYRIFWKKK